MAKKKLESKASGTPAFRFMDYGGKRKGAGRKTMRHADGSRAEPSHANRPRFTKSRPLHITLEMTEDVPNLRAANLAPVVSDAIGRANEREDCRVVHFCLLGRLELVEGWSDLTVTLRPAHRVRLALDLPEGETAPPPLERFEVLALSGGEAFSVSSENDGGAHGWSALVFEVSRPGTYLARCRWGADLATHELRVEVQSSGPVEQARALGEPPRAPLKHSRHAALGHLSRPSGMARESPRKRTHEDVDRHISRAGVHRRGAPAAACAVGPLLEQLLRNGAGNGR